MGNNSKISPVGQKSISSKPVISHKVRGSNHEPSLMLNKIISDYLGKDEKILMFRKVKGKLYLFVAKSKSMGKIPLRQKPKAYLLNESENLWTFIYKLIQEENKK